MDGWMDECTRGRASGDAGGGLERETEAHREIERGKEKRTHFFCSQNALYVYNARSQQSLNTTWQQWYHTAAGGINMQEIHGKRRQQPHKQREQQRTTTHLSQRRARALQHRHAAPSVLAAEGLEAPPCTIPAILGGHHLDEHGAAVTVSRICADVLRCVQKKYTVSRGKEGRERHLCESAGIRTTEGGT